MAQQASAHPSTNSTGIDMAFDIDGARKAGYSEDEIADHLAKQSNFDAQGARSAGYSSADIIGHLSGAKSAQPSASAAPAKTITMPQKPDALSMQMGNMVVDSLQGMKEAGPVGALINTVAGRDRVQSMKDGAMTGAASIGNTLLTPVRWAADKIEPKQTTVKTLVTGEKTRPDTLMGNVADYLDSSPQASQNIDRMHEGDALYAGTKLGTQAALTYPVGGVVGKLVGKAAPMAGPAAPIVSRLATAIESAGMRTGADPTTTLAKLGDMATRVVGGAVNGGATAGLIDPSSAGTGAAIGGVLPPAASAAANVGRRVLGTALTKSGATKAAARDVANAVGHDNLTQTVGDIQTYYPKGAEDIPVSAAGITQNPILARMEQASRLRSAPQWYDFDQTQGKKVYDNLIRATSEADDLGNRFASRAANWAKNWNEAETAVKPRVWVKRMGQLGGDIETALVSPEASNPAVRKTLEALRDEVIRVGDKFSPAHLQQIRAEFNGKASMLDPSAFKAAPRDSAAVKSLVAELDDILNATTGGRWDKVRQGYAADSNLVRASKAASKVRDAFVDQGTGRVRGVSLDPNGDIPKVTEAGLGRAIDSARLPDKSLALSPEAEQRMSATLDALRRQNITQGVKRSSVAGGGSDTVSNMTAVVARSVAGGPVVDAITRLFNGVRRAANGKKEDALAQLFTNPDELAKALDAIIRPQPVNPLASVPYRVAPVLAADR